MSRLRQLDALAALLRGEAPPGVDWMAVLELANQTFVTPQVYAAALRSGTVERLPAEARVFLEEVWRRNRARNRRLFEQLTETVRALNAAGIEPTLLKGAADWVGQGRPSHHDRMLNDLDLLVAPTQAEAAVEALVAAGFGILKRYPAEGHWLAELGRRHDVGLIDLHRRPPGPPDLARAAAARPGQIRPVAWDGVRARLPTPALRIFLIMLHDQFQDGGYWRGEFALRHLQEIAALSRRPGAVDWDVLAALAATRLARNALGAQLHAAARLFGARTPPTAARPWVRLQHARRRAQFGWPRFDAAFRMLAA